MANLTETQLAEIKNRFLFHSENPDQAARVDVIRDLAGQLAELVAKECPNSREMNLALGHLDAVVMFAIAAIARHE